MTDSVLHWQMCEYELLRLRNIENNNNKLRELGLLSEAPPTRRPKYQRDVQPAQPAQHAAVQQLLRRSTRVADPLLE